MRNSYTLLFIRISIQQQQKKSMTKTTHTAIKKFQSYCNCCFLLDYLSSSSHYCCLSCCHRSFFVVLLLRRRRRLHCIGDRCNRKEASALLHSAAYSRLCRRHSLLVQSIEMHKMNDNNKHNDV
ncbi:unnamed protein product [Ceratitis capitata]|uniref:(Mediterranean fruit fly) hypothetical protein n=1 Tax=Ceratitis capitata TaxID=7213 RepID=A0A811UM16_CERCA|nr:unnamed protein product [Ceratitis capitata]